MKRIFTFIIAAVSTAMMLSCEVLERNMSPLGHDQLKSYAGELYANSVVLPVRMTQVAIGLDEYLSQTDQQQTDNPDFHGYVSHVGGNEYRFDDGYVSCTVDTGGKSVMEDGAQWRYSSFKASVKVFGGSGDMYSNGGWSSWITQEVCITFKADPSDDFILVAQVEMPGGTSVVAFKSRDGLSWFWNVSVEGEDIGNDGFKSEYTTGRDTGGINIETFIDEGMDKYDRLQRVYRCFATGMFYVDIYKGTEMIDWVEMTLHPDKSTYYKTSR